MIDTHCHLLPGLDDGPRTREDSIALARALVAEGVTAVLCTPHWSRQFPTEWRQVLDAVERARDDFGEAGIALELTPSSELSPAIAVTAQVELVAERSIGGRYVVVEAVGDTPAPFFQSVAERLASAGLLPVFAHPERSRAVQRDVGVLADARAEGALVQVVAPSLLGRWGRATSDSAWELVDRGLADLVGSDAHGLRLRKPHLREVMTAVRRRAGSERAEDLTLHAPGRLLGAGGDAR